MRVAVSPSLLARTQSRRICLGYFNQHRLPNFTAMDIAQPGAFERRRLRNIRRRPKLIAAFWKQAELWRITHSIMRESIVFGQIVWDWEILRTSVDTNPSHTHAIASSSPGPFRRPQGASRGAILARKSPCSFESAHMG